MEFEVGLPEAQSAGLDLSPGASTASPAAVSPLKAKLSKEEAGVVKRRLLIAEEYAKREFCKGAERARELWLGKHYPNMEGPSDDARVVVNYILPMVQTKVASIAMRDPQFLLEPENAEAQESLAVAKDALRYDWRKSEAMRECRRALWDREVTSLGVVYTGWLFETESGQRREDGRPPVEGEPPDTTPDALAGEPPVAQMEIREDRFLARRICPDRFLVDPECDNVLENAAYCGYWEIRPLEEVKGDRRLSNTRDLKGSAKNLKGYYPKELQQKWGSDEAKVSSDCKRVKLYHYYERRRKLHAVFCDEHEKPLLVEKWVWQADRYPFRVLQGLVTTDDFYGLPEPLLVEHPQQEINESRKQLSTWRKVGIPGYQAVGFTLDAAQDLALRSSAPNRVIQNLQGELKPLQQSQLPQEAFQAESRALSAFQFICGLNEYQTATPPTKRMTAPEVEAVTSGTGARQMDDQKVFEEFVAGVAQDCLAWQQQYSVRTRELPIYDEEDRVQGFRDVTAEAIRGQFAVTVFAGSTAAQRQQDQLQGIGYLLQTLAPFMQQGMVNPRPLLAQLLKTIPGIKNTDQILMPEPPPQMAMGPGMPPPGMEPGGPGGGSAMDQLAQLRMAQGTELEGLPPELVAQMMGSANAAG